MPRNFIFNTLSRAIADPENLRAVVEIFKDGETSEIILIDFDPLSEHDLLDETLPRVGVWSEQVDCEEVDCGAFRSYDEAVSFVSHLLSVNDAELYIDSL